MFDNRRHHDCIESLAVVENLGNVPRPEFVGNGRPWCWLINLDSDTRLDHRGSLSKQGTIRRSDVKDVNAVGHPSDCLRDSLALDPTVDSIHTDPDRVLKMCAHIPARNLNAMLVERLAVLNMKKAPELAGVARQKVTSELAQLSVDPPMKWLEHRPRIRGRCFPTLKELQCSTWQLPSTKRRVL
jgi:hypothetical protein